MRKTVLTLGLILIGIFLVFSFLDRNGRYDAERDIYKLNLQYGEFVKDPKSTPDAQIQVLINGYQKFINHYPDKQLTALAHTLRARVYSMSDDTESAVAEMETMLKNFEGNERLVVQGLIELAQIHAFSRNKEAVLDTYQRLIKNHPLSKEGMQAPLVVARHFVEIKDTAMAARAYVDAIEHYQMLIDKYPDSEIEFKAQTLLATSYVALRNWEKSVTYFSELLLKFANPQFWSKEMFLTVTRSINTISIFELNDFERPEKVYQAFIDKHPDHPFNPELSKMIDLMGEYKKYHDEQQQAAQDAAQGQVTDVMDKLKVPLTEPTADKLQDIVDEATIDSKKILPTLKPEQGMIP